jgi:hypothetical protein
MRRALTLALTLFLGACASTPRHPDPAVRLETARGLRHAIEAGRALGAADPSFTPQLEEASLAWLLLNGPAPLAGARRLLDMRERGQEVAGSFLSTSGGAKVAALAESEAFRNGLFFNNYDLALFRPFFRHALLDALKDPALDDAKMLALLEPLELALRLTPRFAGIYPNQLDDELRADLAAYVKSHPKGDATDRFNMLIWLDDRNGAWEGERERLDTRLNDLAETSQDELLKLELKDALAAPRARPDKAFWMSFLVPGLGQVAHGDVQGGILLGGLTLSAWIWMGSKLAQAGSLDDEGKRVAYGDAAWAGGLALLGHAFTAMNAAEQARFINIVVEWDLLSKDRLSDSATGAEKEK